MEIQDASTAEVSNQPAKPKRIRSWRRIAICAVLWLLAAAVVFLVVFGIGIYRFGWKGSFVLAVEKVVPYPVAMVDWHILSRNDFVERYSGFKKALLYNQKFDFNDPKNADTIAQQKVQIVDRMVEIKLEEILAKRMGIKTTSEEVQQEINNLAASSGMPADQLNTVINNVYGWGKNQFISQVVEPQLIEGKLQIVVNQDKDWNTDAYKKAEEAKSKLAAGEDFVKVAAEYSVDQGSSQQGGDLGWTDKGALVPEFENAALALQPGQVSEIIASRYGLHIIQLVEKKNTDGKDQIHARHILIATRPFTEWMDKQRSSAKIWRFPLPVI